MIYVLSYIIISIITFVCFVLLDRTRGYVSAADLVVLTFAGLVWPFTIGIVAIIQFYKLLEKAVNK